MKKIFLILASVSILFFLQSCSDKELDNVNIETNNLKFENSEFIRFDNPYNDIGIIHNQFLLDIGKSISLQLEYLIGSKEIKKSMMDDVLSITLDSCSKIMSRQCEIPISESDAHLAELIEGMNTRDLVNNPTDFDIEIGELIKSAKGDFTILLSSLFKKEGELITEINIYVEKEELQHNLLSQTLFKYSLSYWMDTKGNNDIPQHNYITEAYINKNLVFIDDNNSKFLFGLFDAAINFVASAVDFVSSKWKGILGGAVGITGCDYAAIHMSGGLFGMGPAGWAAGGIIVGGSSAVGGLIGWVIPW